MLANEGELLATEVVASLVPVEGIDEDAALAGVLAWPVLPPVVLHQRAPSHPLPLAF